MIRVIRTLIFLSPILLLFLELFSSLSRFEVRVAETINLPLVFGISQLQNVRLNSWYYMLGLVFLVKGF